MRIFATAVLVGVVVLLGAVFVGRQGTGEGPDYGRLTAKQAHEKLQEDEEILLVDVRTPEEYQQQRIPDAILLPLADIKEKAEETLPDKDAVVFLYCRSGNRSDNAAALLTKMGYSEIYDIGGIIDWPFETESGTAQ